MSAFRAEHRFIVDWDDGSLDEAPHATVSRRRRRTTRLGLARLPMAWEALLPAPDRFADERLEVAPRDGDRLPAAAAMKVPTRRRRAHPHRHHHRILHA